MCPLAPVRDESRTIDRPACLAGLCGRGDKRAREAGRGRPYDSSRQEEKQRESASDEPALAGAGSQEEKQKPKQSELVGCWRRRGLARLAASDPPAGRSEKEARTAGAALMIILQKKSATGG